MTATVRGAILAGGSARRFGGRPKGLELIKGRRILDQVVDVMTQATGEPPLLIANAPGANSWRPELRVVPDLRPGGGSLGGIYTAVRAGPDPVLCVAWDMPFVTAPLLSELVAAAHGYDVFLPESTGPLGMEPLCAAYGPACAQAIERQLATGILETTGFHRDVKVGTLSLERVRGFGAPEQLFFNVNHPEDLRQATALADELLHR